MIGRPKLVLASGSPRRLALLNQAGIEPDALQPAEVDEMPKKGELPRALRQPAGARQGARPRSSSVQARRGIARLLHPRRRHRGGGRPAHPAEGRDCSTRRRNACGCSPAAIIASTPASAW